MLVVGSLRALLHRAVEINIISSVSSNSIATEIAFSSRSGIASTGLSIVIGGASGGTSC